MSPPKRTTKLIAALTLCLLSTLSAAEIVVVVSSRSATTALSSRQVADIFLGRARSFPDGRPAVPLDQMEGAVVRDQFYLKLLDKTPAQVKAHWSKILFTGRGMPPKTVPSSSVVRKAVAENVEYIGYMERTSLDASVKEVMVLE